jgi:hypothetical protein
VWAIEQGCIKTATLTIPAVLPLTKGNTMNLRPYLGLASAALLVLAAPAAAAPTYYFDAASFAADAPALGFESFEAPSFVQPTFQIFSDVVVVSSGLLFTDNMFPTDGKLLLSIVTPSTITFNFNQPITAFGIDVVGLGTVGFTDLVLTTANGSGQIYADFISNAFDNVLFAGVIDPTGFTAVTLSGTSASDVIEFDRLFYSIPDPVGGVPEPANWALMIAGFGLVGAAQRRHKAILA